MNMNPDIERTMALLGVTRIDELDRSLLERRPKPAQSNQAVDSGT